MEREMVSPSKKPTVLDQGFDHLSSIPYLRRILKALWIFSTVFLGFAIFLEGIAVFTGKVEFRLALIKNLIMWAGVNPFFAYVFYLWNKREQVQANSKETP
jgi:predicted permease